MSFQGAVVNCRRCYALAQEMQKKRRTPEAFDSNDQLYATKNNAIEALERITGEGGRMVEIALNACMRCDYQDPMIVNSLKTHGPKALQDELDYNPDLTPTA